MPTERLDVIIREQGGAVVHRALDDIGRRANNAQSQVDLLSRAFAGLAGILGGREILNTIDQYTTMQNRLRLVTTDTSNLVAVQRELYNVAAQTRTSFEATSTLYARTALSVRQMSLSQQELLGFTKAVNQAVQLSGVSAQEARAGIIQFTQGLAKGRLDGDELRSVLEQLPFVADVIAAKLKITRGEMRDFGSDGKITAQVIVEAFQEMSGNLTELFSRVNLTFDQVWMIFKDRMQQALGAISEQVGVPELLGRIADNMDRIVEVTVSLIPVITLLIARWAAFQALSIAMSAMRNPFTTLLTAAVSYVTYMGQVDTTMNKFLEQNNKHVTMVDRLVATWEGAKAYFQSAWENFPEWFGNIWERAVEAAIRAFAKISDMIPNAILGLANSSSNVVMKNMLTDVAGLFKDTFKSSEELLGELGARALDRVFDPDAAQRAAARYHEAYNAAIIRLAKTNGSLGMNPGGGGGGGGGGGEPDKATQKYIEALQKMNLELDRQEALLSSTADEQRILQQLWQFEDRLKRPLVGTLRDEVEARLRYLLTMEKERAILDGIRGPREEYISQMERINALEMRGDISTQEANYARLQNMRDYFASMPSILGEYLTSLTDVRIEQEKLMQGLADGAITLDVFNAKFAQLGIQEAQLSVGNGSENLFTILTASLQDFFGEFQGLAQGMTDILGDLWSNLGNGIADSIGRALVYAEDLNSALTDVARQAVAQLISSLVKLGIQWVVMSALGQSLAAASTASTVAMAGAAATAWAPAAALASLATVGGNMVAANTALVETVGLAQALAMFGGGFQVGGYTGDGSPASAAGVVHHKEFVVNAAATARNRPALEAMNRGASYGGERPLNITFINETGVAAEAEVRYTTPDDVEVIARRVVRNEAPRVIGRDLDNPTSHTRKSLSRNTNVQSKRNGNS